MNNQPTFLITSVLESCKDDLESLRKKLFEKGVLTKDYIDDGLMLLYHKYDSPITTELERECRSLVIDRTTLKIKSYSCESPLLNKEGMDYLIAHPTEFRLMNPCYEGTYLSIFNHNSKWYVSTRRCLDSQTSILTSEDKQQQSHYEMFEEVLKKAGFKDFNDFSQKLHQDYSYYFVLIHHKNKHIIDYTSEFGPEYCKLSLTSVRDKEMREQNIYEPKADFATYDTSGYIFVPQRLESLESFAMTNKMNKYNDNPGTEGIVVHIWDNEMNKFHLIKLQTMNYQFSQVLGTDRNIFKGLIYLYQSDRLIDYFSQNPNSQNIRKIVNPLNTTESYDTVGMVDAVFKVCTSELFELFKIVCSIKTGQQQNKELYELLPKEYKDIMYAVRGLYYKKKALIHDKDKSLVTVEDIKNSHLKLSDVYNYLKSLNTDTVVAFLRMRKLIFNLVKSKTDNKQLVEFGNTSKFCDKVHLKLCAIFSNKLYPNIMPNDFPPTKDTKDETESLSQTV